MDCPQCRSDATGVVLTRPVSVLSGGGTLRRHACRVCRHRWYSHQLPPAVLADDQVERVDAPARIRR